MPEITPLPTGHTKNQSPQNSKGLVRVHTKGKVYLQWATIKKNKLRQKRVK